MNLLTANPRVEYASRIIILNLSKIHLKYAKSVIANATMIANSGLPNNLYDEQVWQTKWEQMVIREHDLLERVSAQNGL